MTASERIREARSAQTAETRETKRANAYAAKYVNESTAFPTDDEIAAACAGCCRKPRPAEYHSIRESILRNYGDRLA